MKSFELTHVGIIRVAGDDARAFLQRQFTADLSAISSDKASPAAYLSPKGRILANFLLLQQKESFLLVLSNDLVGTIESRLRMYVMRDKVEVGTVTDFVIEGTFDCGGVKEENLELPPHEYDVTFNNQTITVRLPGHKERFFVIRPAVHSEHEEFDKALDLWKMADIQSGIPLISADLSEKFVPQAINLDLTGAISFTKGCYPGQEIVARLHYRGGVNRRMVRAQVALGTNVSCNAKIICPALAGNLSGEVVSYVEMTGKDTTQLLISVPLKILRAGDLFLEDLTAVKILPDALPYTIPELE